MDNPRERTMGGGSEPRCRVLVAGVGGGACRVLDHVLADWEDPPTVAAVNSDLLALDDVGIGLKVTIGRGVAKGMGTGGDAELGRLAASEDVDALRTLVADFDLLILLASLGGGTGTGAAPVLAKLAQESGLLTLAYVTTPFAFEGTRRQEQAQEGLAALKQHADAVVCLPNERLQAMLPPDTPLVEAFAFVDRMVAAGIRGLWTLLARHNTLNLDFSDLQTLVENSGNECCFGYGEGEGERKVEQALAQLLEGPMLERGQVVANSGAMILCVTGGPDLALAELDAVQRRFKEAACAGARIHVGAAILPEWTGRMALTVLAAEHWMPSARKADAPEASKDSLFESEGAPEDVRGRRPRKGTRTVAAPGADGEKGRFKGVAPTIYEGADLDLPTYQRRGIRIPS
jgi:cell division protein FtsZ